MHLAHQTLLDRLVELQDAARRLPTSVVCPPDRQEPAAVVDDRGRNANGVPWRWVGGGHGSRYAWLVVHTSVGLGVPLVIDPSSDRPVFKQIADHLRAAIESGELPAGARMPSEQELIDAHGVARGTIRQAMSLLRSEGLVRTEHGRGTFVRERPPVRRLAHDRFARRHRERGRAAYLAELEAEGRVAEIEVLEVRRARASDEVALWLQLAMGGEVLVRRRRYLADGEPMELATSYVPWELAEGTRIAESDTGPGGIYARLEERGHELKRFSEQVTARMPTADEIRALRLQPGVPVIRLVRVAYDAEEVPVEACDTLMAADRYVLSYELPAR